MHGIRCTTLMQQLGWPPASPDALCIDRSTCSSLRKEPWEATHTSRIRALAGFWCALPVNHSHPLLWHAHDGFAGALGDHAVGEVKIDVGLLRRYRVPFATPSASELHSYTISDPPDFSKWLLLPDFEFLQTRGYTSLVAELDSCRLPFRNKSATIHFRGSSTNAAPQSTDDLEVNMRIRAVRRTWGKSGWDVRLSNTVQLPGDVAHRVQKYVDPAWYSPCELARHQGVLDIDGNTNSWRGLFSKLHMGSVVFKVTDHGDGTRFRQWYYHRLVPGIHYIPTDLSPASIHNLPKLLPRLQHVSNSLKLYHVPELSFGYMTRTIIVWWSTLHGP